MSQGRIINTTTLLFDGRVLVTGGYNGGFLASSEIYEPWSGTWSSTGSMMTSRYNHRAAQLPDGRVLISGGSNASGGLASAEIYDPWLGSSSLTGSMSSPREATRPLHSWTAGCLSAQGSWMSARIPGHRRSLQPLVGNLVAYSVVEHGPRSTYRHPAVGRPSARQRW